MKLLFLWLSYDYSIVLQIVDFLGFEGGRGSGVLLEVELSEEIVYGWVIA